MYGIHYQQSVYILVVFITLNNIIDKYLDNAHRISACYTYNSIIV